ncbi:outer membrane beta-barrel protein [Winogradskyella alexanderae]|uniref:Porin family protein n=1 Tax=Winogradskyella alexanderae TaxID=2877123 RepID=A0ABS7XUQ4_9FLAO|nr:outer membrane beta-barrel protein [Winogradskyella alexanderae]MCA0133738.1 porin family protein [Winogradskyella alexanderae]
MKTKSKFVLFSFFLIVLSVNLGMAQEDEKNKQEELTEDEKQFQKIDFYNFRGTNVVDVGIGGSTIFGNYEDTKFGFYYRLGYKRAISPSFLIGLSANGYNLSFTDVNQNLEFDQSLLSVDLNLEYLFIPTEFFTPLIYGGLGMNMNSDNDTSVMKAQFGFGFEYLIVEKLAFKLFYEYNYSFDDEAEILIADENNDKFMRIGIGVNYYFGGNKQKDKLKKNVKTIMNSNPIIPDN